MIFQFHKGTIRTTLKSASGVVLNNFNSIKVRLEPHFMSAFAIEQLHFNSIKVRLERPSVYRGEATAR